MSDQPGDILRVRITLRDVTPPVWRRLDVPADLTLARLHECIQVTMGWTFSHLHEFRVGDRCYGVPDPEFHGAERPVYRDASIKLNAIVKRGIDRFEYLYDFGDDWRHEIAIEGTLRAEPGEELPRFVDGARRCPPEDCGGPPGYQEFLEAATSPDHPEHDEAVAWYGEEYDPDDIEEAAIRAQLSRIAASRRGGVKGRGKPRRPTAPEA